MKLEEVAEIFAAANAAYETVTSKPTYACIDRFVEKINPILIELPREQDGDECGMFYLSQDPSEYGNITGGSTLTKMGKLSAYDDSINSSNLDAERKKAEVLWKDRLNDSNVEVAAERGAKKMLLVTFYVTYTNKLRHHINLYSGVSYF